MKSRILNIINDTLDLAGKIAIGLIVGQVLYMILLMLDK